MLEAGKQLDMKEELKSMEWPYDHPRRGEMPYDRHAIGQNEYTFRKPPYAKDTPYAKVHSYVQGWGGSDYSKNLVVDEKEHPYTGTRYAWVRSRAAGRQDEPLGAPRPAALRLRFQGEEPRRLRRGLAHRLRRHRPLLRQCRPLPRHRGPPRGPRLPARQHLPAHDPAQSRGGPPSGVAQEDEPRPHSLPRGGHDGRAEAQQVPDALLRTRACGRRAGGCDIHAAFDSPTGLIYPAQDTGRLTLRTNATVREVTLDPATGKARGVVFVDTETGRTYEAKGRRSSSARRHSSPPASSCSRRAPPTPPGSATPAAISDTTSAST